MSGGGGLTGLLSVPLETFVSPSKLQDLVISPTYNYSAPYDDMMNLSHIY